MESSSSVTPQKSVCAKTGRSLWIAFTCAVTSALFAAVAALLIRYVKGSGDQIAMARWIFQYLLLLPVVTKRRQIRLENNRMANILLLVRVVTGIAGSNFYYYSIKQISAGDATAICFSYTALVGIFSYFLLKEPCGILDVFLSALALIGLTFVAQPSFIFGGNQPILENGNRPLGVILACLSAVCTALTVVSLRKMGTDVHFSLSVFYYACAGLCVSIITIAIDSKFALPCMQDTFIMACIGVLLVLEVILLTVALQHGPAVPVTIVLTTQVIFVFALEFAVLRSVPTMYSIIGSAIILASSIGLTIVNGRRQTHRRQLQMTASDDYSAHRE